MRSLWWWGAAELVTVLFLGEAKSKFAPLPDITNRTFINQYIDIHNKFRSEVKPSASNMLYMVSGSKTCRRVGAESSGALEGKR